MSQQFSPGARVPGVVVRLADFGAFVNIAPGLDGLLARIQLGIFLDLVLVAAVVFVMVTKPTL